MLPIVNSFEADYAGNDVIFGRGSIDRLGQYLEQENLRRALVVCGSNTGANEELMTPIRAGLGEKLVSVFDNTTPDKTIEDVYNGITAMAKTEPDVLVGVGGGSSLDVARQMATFSADGRSLTEIREAILDSDSTVPDPKGAVTPVVVVPTTLPGADLSSGGNVEIYDKDDSPTGQPVYRKGEHTPTAYFYDPNLFETTPGNVLRGSAMNGLNKGIETLYSCYASPVTDATATHGISLLHEALPRLREDRPEMMDQAITGIILVQYWRKHSVIHAFAHGFSRHYSVQQGIIHSIMTPHVLEYILEQTDARRELLATALGLDHRMNSDRLAAELVDEITAIRDSLKVKTQLREIDVVDPNDFYEIAEFIVDDPVMSRGPKGFDPTISEVELILEKAW